MVSLSLRVQHFDITITTIIIRFGRGGWLPAVRREKRVCVCVCIVPVVVGHRREEGAIFTTT